MGMPAILKVDTSCLFFDLASGSNPWGATFTAGKGLTFDAWPSEEARIHIEQLTNDYGDIDRKQLAYLVL